MFYCRPLLFAMSLPLLFSIGCCLPHGGLLVHGDYNGGPLARQTACATGNCDSGSCNSGACVSGPHGPFGAGCLGFGRFCHLLKRGAHGLACGGGCGEVYWHDWASDPPCDDPCDNCGHHIGSIGIVGDSCSCGQAGCGGAKPCGCGVAGQTYGGVRNTCGPGWYSCLRAPGRFLYATWMGLGSVGVHLKRAILPGCGCGACSYGYPSCGGCGSCAACVGGPMMSSHHNHMSGHYNHGPVMHGLPVEPGVSYGVPTETGSGTITYGPEELNAPPVLIEPQAGSATGISSPSAFRRGPQSSVLRGRIQ